MFRRGLFTVFLACLAVAGTNAFAPQTQPNARLTQLAAAELKDGTKYTTYAERGRAYRRTVFSHDDWVRFRSSDRFVRNILNAFTSGIYINLGREVASTVGVAAFVLFINLFFFDGFTDLDGIFHKGLLSGTVAPWVLPLTPFTLSSPSLGLLLAFRTNQAYNRWDEARKNWGSNINRTRDLNRMVNAFYDTTQASPERRKEDLERVALATWAFVRSMKRHLSPEWQDEDAFRVELYEKLPKKQAQAIIDAAHRPNRALFDLSLAVENCPMHFIRKNQVQGSLTQFEDNLGSSERLLTSPVPLFYSRHTARFLSLWLLMLPFALYGPLGSTWNHVGVIPVIALLSLFLFGIDELATQMDEPFTILPMQGFCDKIGNWCKEISSWESGDNDAPVVIYNNKNVDTNTLGYYSGQKN